MIETEINTLLLLLLLLLLIEVRWIFWWEDDKLLRSKLDRDLDLERELKFRLLDDIDEEL